MRKGEGASEWDYLDAEIAKKGKKRLCWDYSWGPAREKKNKTKNGGRNNSHKNLLSRFCRILHDSNNLGSVFHVGLQCVLTPSSPQRKELKVPVVDSVLFNNRRIFNDSCRYITRDRNSPAGSTPLFSFFFLFFWENSVPLMPPLWNGIMKSISSLYFFLFLNPPDLIGCFISYRRFSLISLTRALFFSPPSGTISASRLEK